MQDCRGRNIVDLHWPGGRRIGERLIEKCRRRHAFERQQGIDGLSARVGPSVFAVRTDSHPRSCRRAAFDLRIIVDTLGNPPMGADFTKASLIFRAISNLSLCSGSVSELPPPLSIACLNTVRISSGRLSTDNVTPAIKYHEWCGRCGHERIEERSVGDTIADMVTGGIGFKIWMRF